MFVLFIVFLFSQGTPEVDPAMLKYLAPATPAPGPPKPAPAPVPATQAHAMTSAQGPITASPEQVINGNRK